MNPILGGYEKLELQKSYHDFIVTDVEGIYRQQSFIPIKEVTKEDFDNYWESVSKDIQLPKVTYKFFYEVLMD